jgi:uncharacterized membrane protein
METKSWWQSKTVWINIISLLLEIAQAVSGVQWIPVGILTIVVNILNIFLRFLTNTKIA